jgi:hypothetical protein
MGSWSAKGQTHWMAVRPGAPKASGCLSTSRRRPPLRDPGERRTRREAPQEATPEPGGLRIHWPLARWFSRFGPCVALEQKTGLSCQDCSPGRSKKGDSDSWSRIIRRDSHGNVGPSMGHRSARSSRSHRRTPLMRSVQPPPPPQRGMPAAGQGDTLGPRHYRNVTRLKGNEGAEVQAPSIGVESREIGYGLGKSIGLCGRTGVSCH